MDDDVFSKYIDEALESLPAEFKDKLDNVAIVVADYPTAQQLQKLNIHGRGVLLFGLYEGVPQIRRGRGYGVGGTLPDKVTIFKYSILQVARTERAIKNQIRDTVLHEIGHHFGMSERQIRKAMSQ